MVYCYMVWYVMVWYGIVILLAITIREDPLISLLLPGRPPKPAINWFLFYIFFFFRYEYSIRTKEYHRPQPTWIVKVYIKSALYALYFSFLRFEDPAELNVASWISRKFWTSNPRGFCEKKCSENNF